MSQQLDRDFYDPEADPRYLGPSRQEREEFEDALARERAQVDNRIEELRAIREVVGHENWGLVAEMLETDLVRVRAAQGQASDPLVFRELKGKGEALAILLALPLKIEQSLREALEESDSLDAIEGGVEV